MTMTLYELAESYKLLLEAAQTDTGSDGGEGDDGETTAESPFAVALAQLEGGINDKAEGVAAVIRTLELEGDAIEAEAKRMAMRSMQRRRRAGALKAYLLEQLDKAGMTKAGGLRFSVTAQASPPSVRVLDEAAVPVEYQIVIPASVRVDAKAILARWRETGGQGAPVPGTEVVQSRHLRIR